MPVLPTGSEDEQEFIGRCMSEEKSSFPDDAQRYAVCKSKWDSSTLSKQSFTNTQSKVAAKINFERKYEGINITKFAEDGLVDVCWKGYEAIGTKMLDGREVPNCVPIKE